MKIIIPILLFLGIIISLPSCNKDKDENENFYNTEYRIGLWINPAKGDTLEFINDNRLIRKGYYYKYEEYLYRIQGGNLFVRLINSSDETQSPILKASGNNVVLGNMYLSIGFTDNSGTFFKENKN